LSISALSLALMAAELPMAATPALPYQPVALVEQAAPAATPGAQTPAVTAPVLDAPAQSAAPSPPAAVFQDPAVPAVDPNEIVVAAKFRGWAPDPMRRVNEKSYAVVQSADKLVVGPAARFYQDTLPNPLRDGIHNAIYNLREPSVFAAFLLEHKIGKASETLLRFAVNSTVGLAGFIDVAKRKPIKLPRRPNGLADVMGFYGVKPGPYFFLPLIGPTTLRDVIGVSIDRMTVPFIVGPSASSFAYSIGMTIVSGLDDRIRIKGDLAKYRDASPDPYHASKEFYLKRRQAEIDELRGRKKPTT
jgi:phospholipid-binding lipoprotein MlaA